MFLNLTGDGMNALFDIIIIGVTNYFLIGFEASSTGGNPGLVNTWPGRSLDPGITNSVAELTDITPRCLLFKFIPTDKCILDLNQQSLS